MNCKEIVAPITAGVVLCALYTLKNQLRMLYFYLWIIAQIVLESLPISSSGHVMLLEKLSSPFLFDSRGLLGSGSLYQKISFFIHAPSALIIAIFFFKDWFFLLLHFKKTYPLVLRVCSYVVLANVLTVVMYALKMYCALNTLMFLPVGFALTMTILLSLYCVKDSARPMTFAKAALIGVVQGCALMPGISRFAATYVASRWLGLSARRAMQFSFAVQFPLIAFASLYGVISMPPVARAALLSPVVLGVMVCASIVAYIFFARVYLMACRGTLQRFGWYMIVPMVMSLLI